MATRKLKQHAPNFHSTESEIDRPRVGDVRVEEGIARHPESGEVMAALVKHKRTGRIVRGTDASFDVPSEFEVHAPEERAHKVYRYVERPLSGEYGLYAHPDNTFMPRGTPVDDEGFFLSSNGERIVRYVKPLLDERGEVRYLDADKRTYAHEPDPHYWELVSEHPDLEAARAVAEKHD